MLQPLLHFTPVTSVEKPVDERNVSFSPGEHDKVLAGSQSANCLPEAARPPVEKPVDDGASNIDGVSLEKKGAVAVSADKANHTDMSGVSLTPAKETISGDVGLLKRCQGLWYNEEGQKIGTIEGDHVLWCEHTFDGHPCKLIATSDVSLTMELDGEAHTADLHEGPPEKLVWSDGEVWLRNPFGFGDQGKV